MRNEFMLTPFARLHAGGCPLFVLHDEITDQDHDSTSARRPDAISGEMQRASSPRTQCVLHRLKVILRDILKIESRHSARGIPWMHAALAAPSARAQSPGEYRSTYAICSARLESARCIPDSPRPP